MAMHLERPQLTTTRTNGKRKLNKKAQAAAKEHEAWLKKQGLAPEQLALKKAVAGKHKVELPSLKTEQKYELSNGIGNGFKNGVMENLHKEKPEVQKEILNKAARTAPLYSKGGYQYITPGTDITQIGSKSRRG